MGSSGRRVPYLKKVNSEEIARITNGVCFSFGENCNIFYNNGQQVGVLDYVGAPGPGMQFAIRGKKGSTPGSMEDKYVEMLTWLKIPVPTME